MPFKRFVEPGRVALVNYGEDYGKLVTIMDIETEEGFAKCLKLIHEFDLGLNLEKVLVDSPDMVRSQMNLKRLSLTDIKIDIKRTAKKKELLAAMEGTGVQKKWESSSWGRKLIVQKGRAALTDFDRFKLMLAKIKRASLIKSELAKLKKQSA